MPLPPPYDSLQLTRLACRSLECALPLGGLSPRASGGNRSVQQ